MKNLFAIIALLSSLPAFVGDLENIRCALNSHRYGDVEMNFETVPPSSTNPGGYRILTASDYVFVKVKGVVREGKMDGRLFATIFVEGKAPISASIVTPTGNEESELNYFEVGYSIVCRAL